MAQEHSRTATKEDLQQRGMTAVGARTAWRHASGRGSRRQTRITQWLRDALSPVQVIGPEERPKRKDLPSTGAACYLLWMIVAGKRRLLISESVLDDGSDESSDVIEALVRERTGPERPPF